MATTNENLIFQLRESAAVTNERLETYRGETKNLAREVDQLKASGELVGDLREKLARLEVNVASLEKAIDNHTRLRRELMLVVAGAMAAFLFAVLVEIIKPVLSPQSKNPVPVKTSGI